MGIAKYKDWMANSTSAEKKELAIKAHTSLSTLYQLDYGVRGNGKPFVASSEMAGRIEKAIASINKRKRHSPLPEVRRGDLAAVCAQCKFYKSGEC